MFRPWDNPQIRFSGTATAPRTTPLKSLRTRCSIPRAPASILSRPPPRCRTTMQKLGAEPRCRTSMQNLNAKQRHRTGERGHSIHCVASPNGMQSTINEAQTGADPVPTGLAVTNTYGNVLAQQVGCSARTWQTLQLKKAIPFGMGLFHNLGRQRPGLPHPYACNTTGPAP